MIRLPLDIFQRFEALTGGGSYGFRRTGYLLGVDERMRAPMEASVALQRGVGIKTRLVSPAETAQGFALGARGRGARVLEGTELLAVLADGSRVTGVSTSRDGILAPRGVNAAGLD